MNAKDHVEALEEAKRLWDAKPGTPDHDRLDVLATLVDAYEREHMPIPPPDSIEEHQAPNQRPRSEWSWEEHIEEAKAHGGKTFAPNGLPIVAIRHDWAMLEHEHADHPDYKFPVLAVYVGSDMSDFCWIGSNEQVVPMTENEIYMSSREDHAVIYGDGAIILTLYESCYSIWSLADGKLLHGKQHKKDWILSLESLEKIRGVYPLTW